MKATLLVRERVVYPDGSIVEMVVWRVPQPIPPSTHPFKYRLAYIENGRRIVGYDNERGKGDHRHVGNEEADFVFRSIDDLLARFIAEVKRVRSE
jgi:hypothetical protein